MEIPLFKKRLSYIAPVILEKRTSQFNKSIYVRLENGKIVLNTENANYSFGNLHKVFQVAFQKTRLKDNFKGSPALLLGTGGGSVPQIIFNEMQLNCNMTAIEIDPVIIELSKKYFNSDQFKKLEIVCADAYDFVSASQKKYDLIVVDLFIDLKVPEKFLEPLFLNRLTGLLNKDGWYYFNFILNEPDGEETLAQMEENLKSTLKQTSIITMGKNYVFTGRF